jgi:serine protease Do
MKQPTKLYFSVVAIAVLSSTFTAGVFSYFTNKKIVNVEKASTPAQLTGINNYRPLGNLDFTVAAAAVTTGVVHIKTTYQQQNTGMGHFNNPFFDLFGSDFFGNSPYQMMPQKSSGSGVIISNDGYIVTNNHVIDNADKIEVTLHDKKTYLATVIGKDPSTDLALLKVDETNLPFVYFGNSDSVKVGQWVLAVGNPFNLESTVTAGIVSAKGRNINIIKDKNNTAIESFIQTDAAVNPGNSGGALVDPSGQLIGINSAIASPTGSFAGYSFAIPINIVKKVIDDLTKYGLVQRAFLGINPIELTDELSKESGFNGLNGVYIGSVMDGGAAQEAGLQKGDVITKLDGTKISDVSNMLEHVGKKRPGDKIEIEYVRNGKLLNANTTLKNKIGKTGLVKKEDEINESIADLGASFKELTDGEKSKYQITSGIRITDIMQNGKMAQSDIPEGFIITKINKKSVNTIADVKNALKESGGMVLLEGVMPGYSGKYYYSFNIK